jgi:ribosomal 50S subunit-recycling heat shock protein
MCKKERVKVNDLVAKAGKSVKEHDTIQIDYGNRILVVTIMAIPEGNVRKTEASQYYAVLSDERVDLLS